MSEHARAATTDNQEEAAMERFDEKRLRADIVSAWGEYGAHADVFDFMVKEIERLREQRIYLVAALREARPLMSDGEIAFRFDAPGTRGETILLAAFAEVESGSSGGVAARRPPGPTGGDGMSERTEAAINDRSGSAARRTPTPEEIFAQYGDPNRPPPCADCNRRPVPSRLVAGSWIDDHSGTCPQNSALHVCDRCGHRHVDRDFGQALACIMDVPLAEGREMQQRIVDRVANGLGIAPDEPDGNGRTDAP